MSRWGDFNLMNNNTIHDTSVDHKTKAYFNKGKD